MGVTQARFWRRIYLMICLLLAGVTPLVCWYMIPDFNPIEQPLSYFGVVAHTSVIWNVTLLLLAVGIYLNAQASFKSYFKKRRYRRFLRLILCAAVCFLFLTAIVDMEHPLIHKLSAALFFITYNFFIFCFGLLRSLQYVRKGLLSMAIGSLMLLSSLFLLPFSSYGVFEMVYLSLVLYWNSILLYNRIERENRLFTTRKMEANSARDDIATGSFCD